MTMYEPNPAVRPTGEEAGEFVEDPTLTRAEDDEGRVPDASRRPTGALPVQADGIRDPGSTKREQKEDVMTNGQVEQQDAPAQSMRRAAADEGTELAGEVRDQARAVASTAGEQGGAIAQSAVSEGRDVVERAKGAVEHEARQRTEELTRTVRRLGDGLGALAEGRTQDAGPVVGYTRDAADRVGQFAQRLEDRGYDGMIEDVSRFARRRPGAFLAAAGILGFAVGRVVRSGGATSAASPSDERGPAAAGLAGRGDPTVSLEPAMPDPAPAPTGAAYRAELP